MHTDSASHRAKESGTNWWLSILLGILLILAGLFVLRDAVAAKVVSTVAFGVALLLAGLFEIVQSLWAPDWSVVLWRAAVGALYAIGGGALIADPLAASEVVTLAFAAALVASGAVRVFLAITHSQPLAWLLSASGTLGIVGGLVILFKWPLSGLWVFGLAVGADLLLHGAWWVASGWAERESSQA